MSFVFAKQTESYGLEHAGGRYWRVIHKATGEERFTSRYRIKAEADMLGRQARLDVLSGKSRKRVLT